MSFEYHGWDFEYHGCPQEGTWDVKDQFWGPKKNSLVSYKNIYIYLFDNQYGLSAIATRKMFI